MVKQVLLAMTLLTAAGAAQAERTGEAIYQSKCLACHVSGAANAPKLGDAAAWGPRIAANSVESFVATVKAGKNAMPPMGACPDCSDSELAAAVDYMLSTVQ